MDDRPLKILLSDPHLKGGGQVRYVTKLALELTRQGHKVVIGCKPGSVLVEGAHESGCTAHNQFFYRGGLRPVVWRHDLRALQAFIRNETPDILHANGSQDHWISGVGNRLAGRPVCVVRTRHNTDPVKPHVLNRLLNRDWTDYQIAVCEAVRAIRVAQPIFDPDRMVTIHNGVDPNDFQPRPEVRRRIREAFSYEDQHIVIGMAARLNAAKGHRYLFESAAKLRESRPDLRLLILGQGELEQDLKQMVETLGIGGITHFAGFRRDIADCIQAFDIGALPSIATEASSFSLMEQMATGIPMVVSDHGGSKEICRDGLDGFVVAQGQTGPLAEALAKLLDNNQLRRGMGERARERIQQEFTLELLAKRTLAAYRTAMAIYAARAAK